MCMQHLHTQFKVAVSGRLAAVTENRHGRNPKGVTGNWEVKAHVLWKQVGVSLSSCLEVPLQAHLSCEGGKCASMNISILNGPGRVAFKTYTLTQPTKTRQFSITMPIKSIFSMSIEISQCSIDRVFPTLDHARRDRGIKLTGWRPASLWFS